MFKEWIQGAAEGLLNGANKIISNFKADPTKVLELEAELKKLLILHEEHLADIAQKAYETEVRDRESARLREANLPKNSIGVWVQNMSAVFAIVSFVAMLFVIIFKPIPVENEKILYTTFGLLGAWVGSLFNYWFGSSQSSVNKQKEMNNRYYLEKNITTKK